MCNNFHLHLIRDKDWHCAQFSSNCFVVMFTGWQSVTQRCSHWWSAKPSLKTWHLVALFGRNDILPPFLADANESLRSFDSLTLVGGRTAGSAATVPGRDQVPAAVIPSTECAVAHKDSCVGLAAPCSQEAASAASRTRLVMTVDAKWRRALH